MSLRTHNLCQQTWFVLNSTDLCEHNILCEELLPLKRSLSGGELQASSVKLSYYSQLKL